MNKRMTLTTGLMALVLVTTGACAGGAGQVHLATGKALLIAEAGADGVNKGAVVVAPNLNSTQAASLKRALDSANSALSAAHAAYLAGQMALAASQVTTSLNAIADAQSGEHP